MKSGNDILKGVTVVAQQGSFVSAVQAIAFDSREVQKGTLFVAQKGLSADGHRYIDTALAKGAMASVCEECPQVFQPQVVYVKVEDSNLALAVMASNFYDNPSKKLTLVGVTGTNGKTTVATLLYELFQKAGRISGLLSTVKICIADTAFKATHTTPDSLSINKYLSEMVAAGVSHCFMEVSSHGIHQKRTAILDFDGGVFTNLSHDHLDYHKTFLEYRDVKKRFFDNLPKAAFALVNADDKNGAVFLQNTKAKKGTYALKTMADFRAKIVERNVSGMLLALEGKEVWVRLIGDFNAYNLLSIYATANMLGMDSQEVLCLMSELNSVDGRFDYTISKENILTIVDYAHTPDALKNVLQTIEGLRTGSGKIITVMGCGGDRDQDKRSKMGHIASFLSDHVIFTSDNPRFEDPQVILDQIEAGVLPENSKKTLAITDRKQAIKAACKLAKSGDILLVAGKGHESYQEIEGVRIPFDDKTITRLVLEALEK
jgi:UDP-N-acetylmuramoyl-L-alanyl-D-glutamate--2,6-diaminopimelate ligase